MLVQISIWIQSLHGVLIYCPKRTNRSLVSVASSFWWLLGFTGWPFHISWKNSPEGEKWESLVSRFGAFCKLCAIAHIVLQNLEFLCFSLGPAFCTFSNRALFKHTKYTLREMRSPLCLKLFQKTLVGHVQKQFVCFAVFWSRYLQHQPWSGQE